MVVEPDTLALPLLVLPGIEKLAVNGRGTVPLPVDPQITLPEVCKI